MKRFTFILCILFALSLCGCGEEAQSETVPPVSEASDYDAEDGDNSVVETSATEADTAHEESSQPAVTEEATPSATAAPEIPVETVIETKYYTLTLPDSWGLSCFYSVTDGTTVVLRETDSYEAFGGGKLCTVVLVPTDDATYKDFPSYELLAALDTPDGSFYVIALFPTDVQFTEDTMVAYNEMYDQLMDVLYTIQPLEGIEMAMP